jgi:hypothetical protein
MIHEGYWWDFAPSFGTDRAIYPSIGTGISDGHSSLGRLGLRGSAASFVRSSNPDSPFFAVRDPARVNDPETGAHII